MLEIYVIDVDGRNLRQLTDLNGFSDKPTWSPDGRQIAFTRSGTGLSNDTDIYVMDADGGNVHPIASTSTPENWPAWSPDGQWIAFARSPTFDLPTALWVARSDGSQERMLTVNGSQPSWSPDGGRLVFVRFSKGLQLYVIASSGGGERRLLGPGATRDFAPAWSPDGGSIAFVRVDSRARLGLHIVGVGSSR